MRARLLVLPLACLGALGCSALSDFDGYEFSAAEDEDSGQAPGAGTGSMDDPDGGAAGRAGGSGSSGAGMGSAGDDGGAGSGEAGSGGDDGGAGSGGSSGSGGAGSGGTGGTPPEPECTLDDDCDADETCVNEMCVPVRLPSGTSHTAGGGTVTSTGYTLRVSVGVPAPMGRMTSTNYVITLGPAAGRN
jgi:hypothetical protein